MVYIVQHQVPVILVIAIININNNNIILGGSSWTLTSAPQGAWYGVASNSAGTLLAAGQLGSGSIYISTTSNTIDEYVCTSQGGLGCCYLCISSPCSLTFDSNVTYIGTIIVLPPLLLLLLLLSSLPLIIIITINITITITTNIIIIIILSLDAYAFYNCTSLTSVTIPTSVITIGIIIIFII